MSFELRASIETGCARAFNHLRPVNCRPTPNDRRYCRSRRAGTLGVEPGWAVGVVTGLVVVLATGLAVVGVAVRVNLRRPINRTVCFGSSWNRCPLHPKSAGADNLRRPAPPWMSRRADYLMEGSSAAVSLRRPWRRHRSHPSTTRRLANISRPVHQVIDAALSTPAVTEASPSQIAAAISPFSIRADRSGTGMRAM